MGVLQAKGNALASPTQNTPDMHFPSSLPSTHTETQTLSLKKLKETITIG